jgi:uncharacterized protein
MIEVPPRPSKIGMADTHADDGAPSRGARPDDRAGCADRMPGATAERRVRIRTAEELGISRRRIDAAVDLLGAGATVPFIARYRKEATEGLDDTQLRTLVERLAYLRVLEARRAAILARIAEQGKLTDVLAAAIDAASTKQELEDL